MQFKEIHKLVINLPKRTDRLELFENEFGWIDNNYILIEGVEHQNPMVGIGQAHINAISYAKRKGWNEVIIMEDDVVFQGTYKTQDYIEKCLLNAPNDWDILLGGVYYSKQRSPFNDYWERIGEFCGLHFYIVNSKAYDKILEYDFKHHIDRWLNQNNRLNCFVAKKFFATQRDGFSDNTKKKEDYSRLLKKYDLL